MSIYAYVLVTCLIGIPALFCVWLLWWLTKSPNGIYTYEMWRGIPRASYNPRGWKSLLEDIIAGNIASDISGEWDLPSELVGLSATKTVTITRFSDGLITVLFTTHDGHFFESYNYCGYLVCSRNLLPTDLQYHSTAGRSFQFIPLDRSTIHTSHSTIISKVFNPGIELGRQKASGIYEINYSYNRRRQNT